MICGKVTAFILSTENEKTTFILSTLVPIIGYSRPMWTGSSIVRKKFLLQGRRILEGHCWNRGFG